MGERFGGRSNRVGVLARHGREGRDEMTSQVRVEGGPATRTSIQQRLRRRNVLPYAFVTPLTLVVAAVLVLPIVYGLIQSLYRIQFARPGTPFVGLENYLNLFRSPQFYGALTRSLVFMAGVIVLGQFLAIVFGFALSRATKGGLRLLRGISIAPYIVSSIAAAVLFRLVFNAEFGVANKIVGLAGVGPLQWLAEPDLAMLAIIVTQVWTDLPLSILLILAGLQTIDPAYLDAASMDGATGLQRIRHVSLPLITPQLVLSGVLLSYHGLTSLGIILGLTGGGPGDATETLAMMMFREAFRALDQGTALAVLVVILMMNALFVLVYLFLRRRGLSVEA